MVVSLVRPLLLTALAASLPMLGCTAAISDGAGGGGREGEGEGEAGDADGDGVADAADNCPDVDNADQRDGDDDGRGDACDEDICGDGTQTSGEGCDDGDRDGGDGCSATCAIEPGFVCGSTGGPSACVPACGDGINVAAEACDDGNTSAGDGCASDCTIEEGFTCPDAGACAPVCGDGRVVTGEGCDDGDTFAGDGCSDACALEEGWTCSGTPTVCGPVCGDGLARGAEQCDDGGTTPGDGCSATCVLESGYCLLPACTPACGDGKLSPAAPALETCDDGNNIPGDGCSATCQAEPGFTCAGIGPGTCIAVCGDGLIVGPEECDDGFNLGAAVDDSGAVTPPSDDPGCNDSCIVVDNFACTGQPSVCERVFRLFVTSVSIATLQNGTASILRDGAADIDAQCKADFGPTATFCSRAQVDALSVAGAGHPSIVGVEAWYRDAPNRPDARSGTCRNLNYNTGHLAEAMTVTIGALDAAGVEAARPCGQGGAAAFRGHCCLP
jgi:cysteine-rich repeat protein